MAKTQSDEEAPPVKKGGPQDRIAKVHALSSVSIGQKSKNIWLLITAGFTWDETKRILHVSKATIRDVLAGKEIVEE